MDKAILRREFFKLKHKGHSYSVCRRILKSKYDYDVTSRTLKRWVARFNQDDIWNLNDSSRCPHTIHYKVTPDIEQDILTLRDKTGWGSRKLLDHLHHIEISPRKVDYILVTHGKSRESKTKGRRVKWIRWQREHPNSLWQIDHTDEQKKFECYTLSVLDDATRYSLAVVKLKQVTTNNVTVILNRLINVYGKPKQILTDNGSAYGGKSKHSKFDRWCNRQGIKHIRTKIHSPTTNGKVERLFKTMDEELEYCNNDLETFRMRYNHFRPHSSIKGKTPGELYNDFAKWI